MVFPLLHETTAEASQEDHRCPPACDPTGIDWWTEIPISKDSNSPSCLAVPVVGVPFLAQSHSTAKTTNGMHNKDFQAKDRLTDLHPTAAPAHNQNSVAPALLDLRSPIVPSQLQCPWPIALRLRSTCKSKVAPQIGSACASLVSMPPRPGKHHQGAIGVVQGTMHPVVALP
ncbi:hypothetical protein CABS03_13557 [Colletotrichum abscissum]|uniref:Uncharacterized protein n=2 Tax=Colletotrichum acutatum species complex TaxID=2707335 RepID=A0A9P9X988_9PEZI|nr:uncharacterized protein CTAM01_06818 [Colletotrichum tamarilloi]KAI3543047.1 hypothetical protein CABS02_10171 [Colletotrichum abscissum]KAK1499624.1 hypothetical protein CTAM01_06818 [Colletotrichum tamarilloi]